MPTKKAEDKLDTRATEVIIPTDIDLNQYIPVRNGFQGRLIYKSSRTGEKFIWDKYGSEQEVELKELKNAKNTMKGYFKNNWFMFDKDWLWVIDYLGVKEFYKNMIPIDDFDSIFTKSVSEIKKRIGTMSKGQKSSVAYRAVELIAQGEIDSIAKIDALSEALGIELREKN